MDLTQLRYFQTTATSKSMSAAARKLGISQPSLTVAIRQLEKHLGTTLFLRERNGVRLTSTGEVLLRHASTLLSLVEHAEQDVRGLESDEVGSFVIGCHESLGAYFLPGFMSSFLREAPRIELTLWNGSSAAASPPRAILTNQDTARDLQTFILGLQKEGWEFRVYDDTPKPPAASVA